MIGEKRVLAKVDAIGRSAAYWWLVLLLGVGQEAVGLYYQHVLNEWPCVLCIHVRLWVMLLILVAIAGWLCRRVRMARILCHLAVLVVGLGIVERSWLLLGTERGTLQAECGIHLGMPSWFAIDQWFPQVFGVWTSCGYTPELILGITMAEGLLGLGTVLVGVSLLLVLATSMTRS